MMKTKLTVSVSDVILTLEGRSGKQASIPLEDLTWAQRNELEQLHETFLGKRIPLTSEKKGAVAFSTEVSTTSPLYLLYLSELQTQELV